MDSSPVVRLVLVTTDLAVLFLMREGVTDNQARESIKWWVRTGKVRNYGGRGRGQARYDLREFKPLVGRWWPDPDRRSD